MTPKRLYGLYTAVVDDVQDPDGQGRVLVKLPWIREDQQNTAKAWARLSTLMAGGDRGTWFVPEPGDEVVISFMAGNPRFPVVVGALWNGVDAPPEQMDTDNSVRSITSRSGHRLTFDDTTSGEKLVIESKGGHRITLDDVGGTVTIAHTGGSTIEMDSAGAVNITAQGKVSVSATAVDVSAPISTFSGVVKADTVITNAVVSGSYTVGAGNIW